MEKAPLTQAHAHSRIATYPTSSPQAQAEHHRTAAREFERAAADTEDPEALRVLKLLASECSQLAILVEQPSHTSAKTDVPPKHDLPTAESSGPQTPKQDVSETQQTALPPPRSTSPVVSRQSAAKRLTSEIAQARGIRDSPAPRARQLSPAASRPAAAITDHVNASRHSSAAQHQMRSHTDPQGTTAATDQADQDQDTTFNKWWTYFSPVIARVSAPLGFAGLPLSPDSPESPSSTAPAPKPTSKSLPRTPTTSHNRPASDVDITRLFRRSALSAVDIAHDDLRASYAIVGGAKTYAEITRPRSRRGSLDSEAEFVDAAEQPAKSPEAAKGRRRGGEKRTTEELEVQCEEQADKIEELTRRLYMWEKASQSNTMALQASIRSLGAPPPPAPSGDSPAAQRGGSASETQKHVAQLEAQLLQQRKELDRYVRENEKLRGVVTRYRERWERLKEGARVRREAGVGVPSAKSPESPGAEGLERGDE